MVIAASISKPISSASTAARRISQGEYGVQIAERYTTAELQSLVDSINEMSSILKAKEEQKHRLTADVAHELRTPLTNLQGFIEAVIDGIWEPTTEMMVSCHEEIERLTRIVNLLLELDKYEDKRITLQYSAFEDTIARYNATHKEADQLPYIPFHGLRHTSATLLIASKQDVRTVSSRLGHAQASTTMNIYAHALKETDKKAAEALEDMLTKHA